MGAVALILAGCGAWWRAAREGLAERQERLLMARTACYDQEPEILRQQLMQLLSSDYRIDIGGSELEVHTQWAESASELGGFRRARVRATLKPGHCIQVEFHVDMQEKSLDDFEWKHAMRGTAEIEDDLYLRMKARMDAVTPRTVGE